MRSLYCDLSATLWKWSSELWILRTNIADKHSTIMGTGIVQSADGTWVKCSKQQPRQPDECLCFHCNLPGHLKRYCPEIPYCSICRTKRHMQDRCMYRPQKTRHTHPAGKTRDQQKRKVDLPQSSSHHNMCLQCR